MMDGAAELLAMNMLAARREIGDARLIAVGHVTSYDPSTHAVKLALPVFRLPFGGSANDSLTTNPDGTGDAMITPWIQLGTIAAGHGGGFQYAPYVGPAPTGGTQCAVMMIEREYGASLVACMMFNDMDQPPDKTLQSGEFIFKQADSQSRMKFWKVGDVTLIVKGKILLQQGGATGNSQAQASILLDPMGNITATAVKGNVTIQSQQGNVAIQGAKQVTVDAGTQIVLAGGGPAIARVGDATICPAGPGTITSGSTKVNSG